MVKIGFGGGCHWCTEAVFQAIRGVAKVDQGWISSFGKENYFSEGVIVHFEAKVVNLATLISIHLTTHSSTQEHSMRTKYRSAVYTYSEDQNKEVKKLIKSKKIL